MALSPAAPPGCVLSVCRPVAKNGGQRLVHLAKGLPSQPGLSDAERSRLQYTHVPSSKALELVEPYVAALSLAAEQKATQAALIAALISQIEAVVQTQDLPILLKVAAFRAKQTEVVEARLAAQLLVRLVIVLTCMSYRSSAATVADKQLSLAPLLSWLDRHDHKAALQCSIAKWIEWQDGAASDVSVDTARTEAEAAASAQAAAKKAQDKATTLNTDTVRTDCAHSQASAAAAKRTSTAAKKAEKAAKTASQLSSRQLEL